MIRFIPGKGHQQFSTFTQCHEEHSSLDDTIKDVELGKEIRKFYEETVNDQDISENKSSSHLFTNPCSLTKRKKKVVRKKKAVEEPPNTEDKELIEKMLLFACHHGVMSDVKKCLKSDKCDVDCTDNYGWTPLMCAAYSGHADIVSLLLQHGCSVTHTKTRHSAEGLARGKNHTDVIELLEKYSKRKRNVFKSPAPKCHHKHTKNTKCDICSIEFNGTYSQDHKNSVVHLLNSGVPSEKVRYGIDERNKGYQIMVHSGWDEQKGLGSQGQGRKFPVKTKLKNDRKGLGTGSILKARVTHFGPGDESSVDNRRRKKIVKMSRYSHKQLVKQQKHREQVFEKELRRYMNN